MKYDDASWHYGGEFPAGSPSEYGATHIALFLRWCFKNGWAGEYHQKNWPAEIQEVITGTASATSFFFDKCGEKLTSEDLSAKGNKFAERYYGESGLYLHDYASEFGELMYVGPEKAHDFNQFSRMIQRRINSDVYTFEDLAKPKPWWKFW
ncbi:MAG: hypothetical protein JXQ85_06655 [Cognatishimia sp.]|uniref:DUF7832 domain-containing protein n=1 Tax=Cognatishimia sp. TaxID=2211648 RepID=UPI003B8E4F8D